MQEPDLHHYDRKLKSQVKSVKNAQISERNKDLIFEFQRYCVVQGLSKPRIIKYLEILRSTSLMIQKDFDAVTKDDLMVFVQQIQERDYSPWTKQIYKVMIKRFFRWFKGKNEDYPEEVRWINTNIKKSELRLPSEGDLLTTEDVQKLLDAVTSPRDKAFIALLYESGGRVGEIGNLRIKHVKFDNMGAVVTVFGKTGSRTIRVIGSNKYLQNWIANHPHKEDRECFLWVRASEPTIQVSYNYLVKLLQTAARQAKIAKRVNPHSFRHARATYLANHLTEFQMNQYFGWKQGSDMAATYVHMSGRALNETMLKLNDAEAKSRTLSQPMPSTARQVTCFQCDAENPPASKYCNGCGTVLVIEKQRENSKEMLVNNMMNILMQDMEVQQMLMQKMVMRRI